MCIFNIFEVITIAVSNLKATLICPIEIVWDTVTNLNDYSWRSDLKDVRIIDEHSFIEITKDGIETYFKITECIKYQSWIFEIENKNIKVIIVGTKEENSSAVGKVNKPIIGICDNNLSKGIIKSILEEINGE